MRAMVLAAGVGSRLDPLTTQIPKPMVPVANTPVLEHIFNLLKRHGISEAAANLHYLPGPIEDYFGDGAGIGIKISFHREEQLSGDAGGVRACKSFLADDTFLVIMGDLLTDADLTAIVAAHKRKGALATIALKRVDDVSQFGVALLDGQGFIKGFQEKPAADEALSNLASTGIYVFEPEVFKHIPAQGQYGFGRQLFPSLVSAGLPVLGVEIEDYWSDVGTINQYRLSNFAALKGQVRIPLPGEKTGWGWCGAGSIVDPSCRIDGLLMLGRNTRLGPNVKVRGCVVIGDDCLIEPGAELEDSVVWSGVNVERQALLKDSVIGLNCVVKNGSRHVALAAVNI